MTDSEKLIEEIKKSGMMAKGKFGLIRHLEGSELTRGQAIRAKCYECMGHCADGKFDCMIDTCPLYGFMPYRGKVAAEDAMDNEEIEEIEETEQAA